MRAYYTDKKLHTIVVLTLCLVLNLSQQIDLNQFNAASSILNQESEKISGLMNFQRIYDQWNELVDLLTRNENYQRKLQEQHEKYGYLRSGEGTRAEIMQKIQELEEQEYIKSLYENKQVTQDPIVNKKIYELYLKDFRQNLMRDDERDQVPHHKVHSPILSLQSMPSRRNLQSLASTETVTINTLVEPYPNGSCQNNGQISNITQLYYMCRQNTGTEWFRVTEETYNALKNVTDSGYTCQTSQTIKFVCICPLGYYGYDCSTAVYSKCYVNVTNPAFYEGCAGNADSNYYMYSIPGFDPCHKSDFSKINTVNFRLVCAVNDETGTIDPKKENMGYAYRNVLTQPVYPEFKYAAVNNQTGYKVMNGSNDYVQVQFTFFDWKWLSNYKYYTATVTDPDQLAGNADCSIDINFPELETSDSNGNSKYIAGGRAYFEADVVGATYYTYTARGFFDKDGYEEPTYSSRNKLGLILGITIPVVVIVIGGGIFTYCYCKKKREKLQKLE